MSTCMVKVRKPGQRRFYFVTPHGQQNRLRVHAARFEDKDGETGQQRAQKYLDIMKPDNPGCEWRIVH